jgi:DNA/RNA-binding domain of Phe-tRNA-synthetase-like protein
MVNIAWQIENGLPIRLAVLQIIDVRVTRERTAFAQLEQCAAQYRQRYADAAIGAIPQVQHGRTLFHSIGQDPTKRRPSSEALLNRALKGKELFSINTLVDVGNWCSLDFLLPICIYDAARVGSIIEVRRGRPGEGYLGHNEQLMNMENRYVLADEQGPFGSPITDSQRTAVSENTRDVILGIFAPQDFDLRQLQQCADTLAQRTLEICGGQIMEKKLF